MDSLRPEQQEFAVTVLERLMETRKLTQTQMHELSGVSQSHIAKIIKRDAQPTDDVLRKLFEALGLKLDDLVDDIPKSAELVGYLATPLTDLRPEEERERDRVISRIRDIASRDEVSRDGASFRLYWPGDVTHPTRHPSFSGEQVYLTDRSRASTYDFIVLFCASPSFGVGQENEIATQAGLPAIRLTPHGLSRMMLGSFIGARDVPYHGDLRSSISFDEGEFLEALKEIRKRCFHQRAQYAGLNGHDFGKRLHVLVSDRRGDNQRFAEDLGVSLGYVLSLMNEPLVVSNPSARLLQRMSRLLNVSVGYLLGEATDSDPVVVESTASWNAWIESTPGVEAIVANGLLRDWKAEDSRRRREPQLSSLRTAARKPMARADWDGRYQEAQRHRQRRSPSPKAKTLFDQ